MIRIVCGGNLYCLQLFAVAPLPSFSGMRVRSFHNLPKVQEVECSGSVLDPGVNILSMALYSSADNQVLASANLKDNECSTSTMFASCHISNRNARHTAVRVLVLGLGTNEWRKFTCEVNSLKSDGRSQIIVWSLRIQGSRKSELRF